MPEEKYTGIHLKQLAEQKEQEWREVQQLRVRTLEASLEKTETELSEQKLKFNKLKDDFKYNLKLLNERHAELDNYDKLILELRGSISKKEGELSDLKIRLDEVQTTAGRESASREDMARHYQQRVREKEQELNSYRAAKDEEVQEERERLEASRRVTERRILQLEEELATQKQELSYGFEEAIRQREHEFRKQADEMNSSVLAHELKSKLLTKELEVVREAAQKTSAVVNEADSQQRTLQKQLKRAQWELHDVSAMKDSQISELKGKLDQTEKAMARMQEDFARRHEELDRVLREKEQCLSKVKEASHEVELKMTGRIHDLEAAVEDAQLKVKQAEWNIDDLRKDKDSVIEGLQSELKNVRTKCESRLSELAKDSSARDLELVTLKDSEAKLREELIERKADIGRYKRDLSSTLERQSDLERAKAQLDLDWQHRYDDIERKQYERSEDLVKGLTRARDEASAEVTEKQRELSHCEELIRALTADRNQALTLLRQHGIPLDHNLKAEEPIVGSAEVEELRVQNENLRAVVRQMRKEMETLGEEIPPSHRPPTADGGSAHLVANEYVKNLEAEIQEMKAKVRKLQHEAKHGKKTEVKSDADISEALAAAGDNIVVKTHVESLNNAIGALRGEKTELVTQLRKQQTRIAHLESGLSQLSKQPLQKQATIEQLQYELSSQQRRHQVEAAGLKDRLGDLDLQLAESRKEADEYYKASIERNLEMTAQGNEVSKLKMALAEKRPTVNYGAQELMIQQLQDEIDRLRKMHRGEEPLDLVTSDVPKGPDRWADPTVERQLRDKLKQAARHISQLAREKKQLIEMGNRLRAQLNKAGINSADQGPSHPPVGPLTYIPAGPPPPPGVTGSSSGFPPTSSGHLYGTDTETSGQSGVMAGLSEKMKNKLIQLEQRQYELMKQKLAAEQQNQFLSTGDTEALSQSSGSISLGPIGVEDEDGEDNNYAEEEYRPTSILKKSARDPLVKLSPVPEDTVPRNRPRTAPSDIPRPDSALSDSFRPTTGQSARIATMLSMSSVGGESLAEVWKLLDEEGISPRPFTPMHSGDGPFRGLQYPGDVYDRSGSSQGLAVRGSQPNFQPKPRPQSKPAVHQPITKKAPAAKKPGPKPRIRNYNQRDG